MATKYDPTTADPGQIEKIPAAQIVIDPNVRKDIRRDNSFISSIRVLGFQQHPVGYRDGDQVHITVGQRRISAALEIGWPVIPIVIKPKRDAEADRTEELRLLEQIAENEQRAPLTPAELAAGYKQLALLGVTEDQIARKTNTPKTTVHTALTVAASDVATAALESRPITLEQAALLVEFENDPDAVEEITTTLTERPEQIDHTAARIRRDRAEAAAVNARAADLEAEGWIVHREHKHYGWEVPAGTRPFREVCQGGDDNKGVDADDSAGLIDRHAVVYPSPNGDVRVASFIGSLDENGLTVRSYYRGNGARQALTDDEKDARRQKRTDKADMITATDIRRAWLKDFLAHKTAAQLHKIPGLDVWIARAVLQSEDALGLYQRDGNARNLTWELLGLAVPSTKYHYESRGAVAKYLADNPNLATAVTAAYAIALAEDLIGDPKHAWAGMQRPEYAPYLVQLQTWGYTLSDVEQRLVDAAKPKRTKAVAA